ncbi:MAG: sulfite exporter TauE/SafE family protein [Actinomycetota bacterium]|nr:sulfite exporter TauE/SafE family protein [Actinomycetota bacterium]
MVDDDGYERPATRGATFLAIGLVAGVASGLLGVGGGTVMVPLLTAFAAFSQHRAHATSLAAIVPIAAVAVVVFAAEGVVEYDTAALLALGSIAGAPLGARAMAAVGERSLEAAFGLFLVAVGIAMVAG